MKRTQNIFEKVSGFEDELGRLENKVLELEHRIEVLMQIERNHLVRVKNNEELSDDFIIHGRKYQDLSPQKAWKLYKSFDYSFILIDVSSKDFQSQNKIPEAIHIPWEEFKDRFIEIQSRTTPLLIISEDGTNSVLACDFLVKKGYFNCNNVSGGYKFWVGFRLQEASDESA